MIRSTIGPTAPSDMREYPRLHDNRAVAPGGQCDAHLLVRDARIRITRSLTLLSRLQTNALASDGCDESNPDV